MVEFEIDWKGNQLGINPQKLALKPRPTAEALRPCHFLPSYPPNFLASHLWPFSAGLLQCRGQGWGGEQLHRSSASADK